MAALWEPAALRTTTGGERQASTTSDGVGIIPSATTGFPCAASSERRASGWPRNMVGFFLVSGLLHLAALAAVAHRDDHHARRFAARLRSGVASVALAASVPSPRREHAETVKLLPRIEAAPLPPSPRAKLPTELRPAAAFASVRIDEKVALPQVLTRRAEAEDDEPARPRTVQPPKQSAPVATAIRSTALAVESPASAPARASSGVVQARPPEAVVQVEPRYPRESLASGEQGVVKIWFRVGDDGRVQDAGIYRSSGYPRLDAAALEAALKWSFESAVAGKPRAAMFVEPFTFRLTR